MAIGAMPLVAFVQCLDYPVFERWFFLDKVEISPAFPALRYDNLGVVLF